LQLQNWLATRLTEDSVNLTTYK